MSTIGNSVRSDGRQGHRCANGGESRQETATQARLAHLALDVADPLAVLAATLRGGPRALPFTVFGTRSMCSRPRSRLPVSLARCSVGPEVATPWMRSLRRRRSPRPPTCSPPTPTTCAPPRRSPERYDHPAMSEAAASSRTRPRQSSTGARAARQAREHLAGAGRGRSDRAQLRSYGRAPTGRRARIAA
jgi:hypothetical protein